MHISRRYTNNKQDQEDVFQESFLKIFRGIKKAKKIDSLRNWIHTICLRTSIDFLRKRKKVSFESITDGNDNLTLTNDDIDIFQKMEYEEVMKLIQTLPDIYRTIFNLYLVEGYPHKEIAELLGISESTSRSQLTRCKSIIRKQLNELKREAHGREI